MRRHHHRRRSGRPRHGGGVSGSRTERRDPRKVRRRRRGLAAPLRPPPSAHGPSPLRPAGPGDTEGLRPLSLARSSRRISRGLRGKVRPETDLQRACSRGAARRAGMARRGGRELAKRARRRRRDRLGRLPSRADMARHRDVRRPGDAFERLSQSGPFGRQTRAGCRLWQLRRRDRARPRRSGD